MEYTAENLGKTDPQYGGVLTDLDKLPIGTKFYVHNGGWEGEIIEIKGVRCVKPKGARPQPLRDNDPDDNILALSNIRKP